MSLIKKLLVVLSVGLVVTACTEVSKVMSKNHQVTFEVDLISNDGNRPFKIECTQYEKLAAFTKDQSNALMSGKKPTVEKPKVIEFKTAGKPENKLTAILELPEDKMVCATDNSFFVIRLGEQKSEVFIPKGNTTLKVTYNMYSRKLHKADSTGALVELVQVQQQ